MYIYSSSGLKITKTIHAHCDASTNINALLECNSVRSSLSVCKHSKGVLDHDMRSPHDGTILSYEFHFDLSYAAINTETY